MSFARQGASRNKSRDKMGQDLDEELARAMSDLKQIKEYYKDGANLSPRIASGRAMEEDAGQGDEEDAEKLNVAEAVIRKLYKRNLELEKTLREMNLHMETKQGDETGKKQEREQGQATPLKTSKNSNNNNNSAQNLQQLGPETTSKPKLQIQPPTIIFPQQNQQQQLSTLQEMEEVKGPPPRIHFQSRTNGEHQQTQVTRSREEEHLRLMLETRERTIEELQSVIERLKEKLREDRTDKMDLKRRQRKQKELEFDLKNAALKSEYLAEQVESMRAAQMARLGTKNGNKKLTALLTQQLDGQTKEHERERGIFNAKLEGLELENGELFVQYKMMESKLSQVSAELEQRDVTEAKIQEQVHNIFQYMKKLEAENANYKSMLGSNS